LKGLKNHQSVIITKRRRSKTTTEEVGQSEGVDDDEVNYEEIEKDEELLVRTRPSGIAIGGEAHKESEEEGVDHSKKHEFFIQQRPRGSGEGSGNEEAGDAQADVRMTEPLVEKLEATKVSFSLTLSSAEFTSMDLNDNPDMTVNDVLKDPVEPKVQSMVDVPAIDMFVPHIKNVLLKDTLDFGKIKMKKAAKKSIPKYSATTFDPTSLMIYDLKHNLFKIMRECKAYHRHPTHKALYDALVVSLSVDKVGMDMQLENLPKKRRRDDQDQDPRTDADKESKKKKMKESDAPSSKKTKDQPTFFKTDKSVQAKETVEELGQEEAKDDEEPTIDEVVNTKKHLQDDASLSQD
nr:hypothetical protein [Tanacetum cinerariifolium]